MIGTVRFKVDEQEVMATLHDNLTWTVPAHPILESAMDLSYGPDTDHSPADGQPGYPQLHEAAKDLDGVAEFADLPSVDPDRIY